MRDDDPVVGPLAADQGRDLRKLDPATEALLTNDEVLAANGAPLLLWKKEAQLTIRGSALRLDRRARVLQRQPHQPLHGLAGLVRA